MPKIPPWVASLLVILASVCLLTLLFLPLGPWLHPPLRPAARLLSGGWLIYRLIVLSQVWEEYQSWRVNPAWDTTPEEFLHDA
jgi:hypothetical protein